MGNNVPFVENQKMGELRKEKESRCFGFSLEEMRGNRLGFIGCRRRMKPFENGMED